MSKVDIPSGGYVRSNYKPDIIRSTILISLFYLEAAIIYVIFLPAILINREWTRLVCRKVMTIMMVYTYRIFGLSIIFEGSMAQTQAIVAANHMHAIDGLFILPILNMHTTFISKKFHKFLMLYLQDFIFVRDNVGQLRGLLSRAYEEAIIKKKSITIFPQATRVPIHEKGVYKTTTGLLARYLNLPVVPISLNTGYSFGGHKGTNLDFSKPIHIKIHEAIVYDDVVFDCMYHQSNRLDMYIHDIDVDKLNHTIEMMCKLKGDTTRKEICEWILEKIKPFNESVYYPSIKFSSAYIKFILSNYAVCDVDSSINTKVHQAFIDDIRYSYNLIYSIIPSMQNKDKDIIFTQYLENIITSGIVQV